MQPIANNLTYEIQNTGLYINPRYPTYVVSGAVGAQSSPSGTFLLNILILCTFFVSSLSLRKKEKQKGKQSKQEKRRKEKERNSKEKKSRRQRYLFSLSFLL